MTGDQAFEDFTINFPPFSVYERLDMDDIMRKTVSMCTAEIRGLSAARIEKALAGSDADVDELWDRSLDSSGPTRETRRAFSKACVKALLDPSVPSLRA